MVDVMTVLYESTETAFVTNGLGGLTDAIKCTVVEERNGAYELEMEYPVSGKRFQEIKLRRIIFTKPNPHTEPQPFRIYNITKPMNGIVTVNAEHISYDLSGYPIVPFTGKTASEVLRKLKEAVVINCPFVFSTDIEVEANLNVTKPTNIRALLGGEENSILDIYGGEYEFDGFSVKLHAQRGEERGVFIRYGKNMTDFSQEENCSEVYTGVYPFWCNEVVEDDLYEDDPGFIDLPEKVVAVPGQFDFSRIYPLDLSEEWPPQGQKEDEEEWNTVPTEEQVRELALKYIRENNIGIPKVSLTVSFEQLAQSEEYKLLARLDEVRLCDSVGVEFRELGVNATFKCIKTTYNVLTGKYVSIEFGEAKSSLAHTMVSQDKTIREKPTKMYTQKSAEHSSQSAYNEANKAYASAQIASSVANDARLVACT
ncbi:phage tail spike protein, partial [Lachnospiraceae bacterium 29-84]